MAAPFSKTDDSVVVIIGTGAGGGTLANELAQKGIPVVALEAGGRYLPEDYVNDEWASFAQLAWLDTRRSDGSFRLARDFAGLPSWIVKAVGGTTTHWAGASLRFQDHEWKALTTYGRVEGASLMDWPIDAAEMDPWYTRAEAKMGVTRTNGLPGLPGNNNYLVMEKGARAVGYDKVHTGRMAINSIAYGNRQACQQTGFCFQGCKWGAKWSTAYTEIPLGEETGNLEVRERCHAARIEHDDKGRVTGVVYFDADGVEQRQAARLVCGLSAETLLAQWKQLDTQTSTMANTSVAADAADLAPVAAPDDTQKQAGVGADAAETEDAAHGDGNPVAAAAAPQASAAANPQDALDGSAAPTEGTALSKAAVCEIDAQKAGALGIKVPG